MAGFAWAAEEEIIAIWLASVGVSLPAIVRLLGEKGYSRTMVAVSHKIRTIRNDHNLGSAYRELNLEYVDYWIHDNRGRDLDLKSLLRPTLRDQQIIDQVRFARERMIEDRLTDFLEQDNPDLDILSHFSSRIDKPNRSGLFATDYTQHTMI